MSVKKQDPASNRFDVSGKMLTWHPEPWADDQPLPDIVMPIGIKYDQWDKIETIGPKAETGNKQAIDALFEILSPESIQVIAEMDIYDILQLITTWKRLVEERQGVSLGESAASSG